MKSGETMEFSSLDWSVALSISMNQLREHRAEKHKV
jgi:hypothetical protein